MILLSLHLTDLNQCKEIERFLFLFRWVNFQHVLLFVLFLFVANWRLLSKFQPPDVVSQWRPKWSELGELR